MTSKIEGWSNRQKDTGWGCAFAHWIPFFWIYYSITRRTITPLLYQTCGAFVIGFSIGFISAIVNPNVEEETLESLGTIGSLIGSPFLVKKGIDQSRLFAKNKLNNWFFKKSCGNFFR